jgi:peroxiredoxin/Cu/Ag efflux protein CusF
MPRDRVLLAALVLSLLLPVQPTPAAAEPRADGEGAVVGVDRSSATITLDHGPIRGVMPAMRMAFRVERPDLIGGVQPGDVVRFTLQSRGPEWVIVAIQQVGDPPAAGPARFPAPDFTLRSLDGATLSLSRQQGKAVLLNFWATWCIPCRTEMLAIERLYQRHKDQGLEVIAINLDVLSTAGVEAFLKEVTVTFPIVLDPEWSTARAYRVLGLPTTYLIDRAGNVVVRETGARDWDDQTTHAAVTKLLESRSLP